MIEILVAMAVIVILLGILFVGIGGLVGSSKEKQTRTTLAMLSGMLGELDAKTRLSKSPAHWRWLPTGSSSSIDVTTGDFWRTPYMIATVPDPLDAPGDVTAGSTDGQAARNGSRQILNTQLAMTMILGLPENRAALQQISADSQMQPTWDNTWSTIPIKNPGSDGALYYGTDGTEALFYPMGAKVISSGTQYTCVTPAGVSGGAAPAAGPWAVDSSSAVPLILDAWDNPIIFVPGSGLRVRKLNGKDANDSTDIDQSVIIVSKEGSVRDLAGQMPTVVTAGRPFFASAGPDGDFAKGDDNIYSFTE